MLRLAVSFKTFINEIMSKALLYSKLFTYSTESIFKNSEKILKWEKKLLLIYFNN